LLLSQCHKIQQTNRHVKKNQKNHEHIFKTILTTCEIVDKSTKRRMWQQKREIERNLWLPQNNPKNISVCSCWECNFLNMSGNRCSEGIDLNTWWMMSCTFVVENQLQNTSHHSSGEVF
jgi:hypothetical protein